MDNEDPGFTVTAQDMEIGENIIDAELALMEDWLADIIQGVLRESESDAEG